MRIDDNTLYIICIMFIILMLFIYAIGFLNRSKANDYPETAVYPDMLEFKNGDIVAVSYNSIAGAIVTSFSSSIWSHTGTVWIEPITNIRYVLEGAIYRHKKYHHFFKIPLETWLFFNKKFLVSWKKYEGPPIDSNYLWSKFEWLHKNCKLEGFNVFWSRFLAKRDYYEYSKVSKYTCIEGTIILGQDTGIYKKNKIYSCFYPGDIVNDVIEYEKDVSYSKPIKISIDPCKLCIFNNDLKRKFWSN